MGDADRARRPMRVTDPAAAAVVADPSRWNDLETFMAGPIALSDAARRLGMRLPALSYRVRQYLALGLLEVTHVERRRGSPMKHYRTTADHLFVPVATLGERSLEALLETISRPFDRMQRRALARTYLQAPGDWGLNFYRSGEGFSIGISTVPEEDASFVARTLEPSQPAVFDSILLLPLDFATAKELQRELEALHRRYAALDRGGHQTYLLRLGLVPLPSE